MKTIKFNDKEYQCQCPQAWNEITIRQQMAVKSLSSTQTYIKSLGVISAYSGIPMEVLRGAKTSVLVDIMSNLEFIDTPINAVPIFKFTYKGEEYNVAETILKQEFQDYVAAQTAIAEYKEDEWRTLAYLTAIMAKKANETLDSYDVNDRAEYFMDLDVETCNRVAAFFLSNQRVSDFISLLSSPAITRQGVQSKVRELENTLKQLKEHRGGNLLIRLWIFIINLWIKYYIQQWKKYCNSQVSKHSTMKWWQIWKRLPLKKVKKDSSSLI